MTAVLCGLLFIFTLLTVAGLYDRRRTKYALGRLVDSENGLSKLVTECLTDLITITEASIRLDKDLTTALSVLTDIRDQNHGDPVYDVWARKRADDTLKLIGEHKAEQ